ncbi:MAG: filamentation induced by cAMP protein fic [Methylophilaceae bacterium]|nr:filamentation induced by cAMP protein fic [Methylophilaceae bacterium]
MSTKSALLFTYREAEVQASRDRLSLLPDKRRALFMAERGRVDFVYNTAALEGNPFTYPEVKTLLDGITVGGHKLTDLEQVLRLNRALSHLIGLVKENKFQFDAKTACEIQGIVACDEALTWGKFRDGGVEIGGTSYKPPKAENLAEIFARGEQALNAMDDPIFKAFLIFLWGSLNQFFYDGNKRTSRFLANGVLMSTGFPPVMIQAKDQLAYNQVMTRFYDSQEGTEALVWFYEYYRERIAGLGFDVPPML